MEIHQHVAWRGAAVGRLHGMAAIAQDAVIATPAFQGQGEESAFRGAAVERVVAGGASDRVDAGEAVGRVARLGRGAGAVAGKAQGNRPGREIGIAQRVGAARAALDPVGAGAAEEHLAEAAADQGVVAGGAGSRRAARIGEEGAGDEIRGVERHRRSGGADARDEVRRSQHADAIRIEHQPAARRRAVLERRHPEHRPGVEAGETRHRESEAERERLQRREATTADEE